MYIHAFLGTNKHKAEPLITCKRKMETKYGCKNLPAVGELR